MEYYVYLFGINQGLFKVGYTQNIKRRIKQLSLKKENAVGVWGPFTKEIAKHHESNIVDAFRIKAQKGREYLRLNQIDVFLIKQYMYDSREKSYGTFFKEAVGFLIALIESIDVCKIQLPQKKRTPFLFVDKETKKETLKNMGL